MILVRPEISMAYIGVSKHSMCSPVRKQFEVFNLMTAVRAIKCEF